MKAIPDVPAHAGVAELRSIVIKGILEPLLDWLKDFSLDFANLELCNQYGTPIPPKNPDVDAILKPNWYKQTGKSTPRFVGPTGNRPIHLYLVMAASLYDLIIDH